MVGVNNCLNQVPGFVLAVRQQPIGIFGQAVAAVAKARVVVVCANAKLVAVIFHKVESTSARESNKLGTAIRCSPYRFTC